MKYQITVFYRSPMGIHDDYYENREEAEYETRYALLNGAEKVLLKLGYDGHTEVYTQCVGGILS